MLKRYSLLFHLHVFFHFQWYYDDCNMQTIVRVLEVAGGVMDELAALTGPRKELINNHCREFMQMIKVSQSDLICSVVYFILWY